MNRLYLVEYNGENTQYGYDVNGNQIKMIHSNGMKSSYTFDGRNLLTGIINTSPDGTSKKYYYNYDAEGLLTEKKEPKGTTAYIYNGSKQLVSMTEPGGRETSYIYDKAGNRKSQKVQNGSDITEISYTYNSQNRLTATVEKTADSVISTVYHYDANGNQTSVVETDSAAGITKTDSYTYDELNQLTHIEGNDGSTADYTYYATGLRASKNVNGSTAVFTYDGTKLLSEQTGNAVRTNIYGTNMIATAGADVLYYQYNNHGDVISVLDQDGTVENEYDYDAFGNAITEKETVSNPYRYAGYYQDSESGLYYLQSRYYNPRTARFLTEDTASGKYTDPLSLNKYTYCHNQPVTGYDPDGHALHIVAGALIGGVIGGIAGGISASKQGKSIWKGVAGGFAGGAIMGAGTALTFGVAGIAAASAGGGAASIVAGAAAGAGTGMGVGAVAGASSSVVNQGITKGFNKIDKQEVATSSVQTSAGMAMTGLLGGVSPGGSKIAGKIAGKVLEKAGVSEAVKAGGTVASKILGASIEGGITGSVWGTAGDCAGQNYLMSKDLQSEYNVDQTAQSAKEGAILGGILGGAFEGFANTKFGNKFIGNASGNKESSKLYSDEFLVKAANKIHKAQYSTNWWGKKNPISVTQASDGTVVVSKNNGVIAKLSRIQARKIFGEDVIIARGRGANYDNTRWGIKTPKPNHAEARGIQALLKEGIDPTNARQATTLPSCEDCFNLQKQWEVINLTGKKGD